MAGGWPGGLPAAGRAPETVLPLTLGSVSVTSSSTVMGGSTLITRPCHSSRLTSVPSFRYLAQSSSRFRRVSSYVVVSMNTNCARAAPGVHAVACPRRTGGEYA